MAPTLRDRRLVIHGEVARLQRYLTPVRNRVQQRAGEGKLDPKEVGYLKGTLRDP
jgi:hypothetical protein